MMNYDFFIAQLRFIAQKTEREAGDVSEMMDALEDVIVQLESGSGTFHVKHQDLRITARALAGVAGFMQQHILPEVIAAVNPIGEEQVRWTIETCMSMMANLMTHAELNNDEKDMDVELPPRPESNS